MTTATTAVLSSGIRPGSLLPARASDYPGQVSPVIPKKRRRRAPKPPKESRIRKAVVATIALRAQGFSLDDAAEQLGLTKGTVKTYLQHARREGWIDSSVFVDPYDKLEHVLQHQVVENLGKVLVETNAQAAQDEALSARAINTTLEVAKGTGLLKQHQVVKGEGATPIGLALRVQVEMPTGVVTQIREGSIGGTPAIEAEIIDTEGD